MSQAEEITYVFCGCFPFRQPPNLLEPLIHSLAPPKPRSGARPKLVEPTHITTKRATLGSRGSIFLDDHVQNMAGYAKTSWSENRVPPTLRLHNHLFHEHCHRLGVRIAILRAPSGTRNCCKRSHWAPVHSMS